MHALIRSAQRYLALTMLSLMLVSQLPLASVGNAQAPTPATTPAAETGTRIHDPSTDQPAVDGADQGDAPAEEPVPGEVLDQSAVPFDHSLSPDIAHEPTNIQGIVTIDVSVPETIRPGELLTYTYKYKNTGGTTISNLVIDATFTEFSYTASAQIQWCSKNPTTDCGLLPRPPTDPSVTFLSRTATNDGLRFTIGPVAPNQEAQFAIELVSNKQRFPKTGQGPQRPAGSGRTFLGATPDSFDTATSQIVSPVFYINKTKQSNTIYPLQTAAFTLTVGNATGPGDTGRTDAVNATGVIIKETIPSGSELISAEGNPVVTATTLTWTIASLPVGQSVVYRLVFKKLDLDAGCGSVSNSTYNVTSNEIPFSSGTTRYTVAGPGVSVLVQVPMTLQVVASPSPLIYEHTGYITFTVKSFYNQAMTGVKLQYDIQSNVFYVPGSANPAATSAPTDPNVRGGTVIWTFDMPASTILTPTQKIFSVRVKASTISTAPVGTGFLTVPANVPSACIRALNVRVNLTPRVLLTKKTTAPPETISLGYYIVTRGQQFPYTIDIQNRGLTTATNVVITDTIPPGFTYVDGSAMLDTTLYPPTITSGPTRLVWRNISVPAGQTRRLSYKLTVSGLDYVPYCNRITGKVEPEELVLLVTDAVCVKIQPNIRITKVANKTVAGPGEEVEFTLTLTNQDVQSYDLGIVDFFDKFVYVRKVTTYDGTDGVQSSYRTTARDWSIVAVAPGASIQVVIIAAMPTITPCVPGSYINRALFHNPNNYIVPVPEVQASVEIICNRIDYVQSVDRTIVSLLDQVVFTLNVRNNSDEVALSVVVTNVLPLGFTYVGMHATSDVTSQPTQSTLANGRKMLRWTISSIAATQNIRVKYTARASDTVGIFQSLMYATAPGRTAVCTGGCVIPSGETINYSAVTITVQALITMEPSITPVGCAQPGALVRYKVVIANTNIHDYNDTQIKLSLPYGLEYVRALGTTIPPAVTLSTSGESTLVWTRRKVLAKPTGGSVSLLIIEVELRVGEVWGSLNTIATATSPDGLIPRKDGVLDPTVSVCPPNPSFNKLTPRRLARIGDEVLYVISIGNPTNTAISASLQDILPSNVTFVRTTAGPAPVQAGNTLTWANLTIPAAQLGLAGGLQLHYIVRVTSGTPGALVNNTVTVSQSSTTLTAAPSATATFRIAGNIIFIPGMKNNAP